MILLSTIIAVATMITASALSVVDQLTMTAGNKSAHLVVLIHGWQGNHLEMQSIQDAVVKKHKASNNKTTTLVLHSTRVNEGRTNDGIAAGGVRIANELDTIIQAYYNKSSNKLSLSFIGNSMGGLYARYALGMMQTLDTVNLQTFVTTATPHLGVSQYTYLTLPRSIERVIAAFMQQTGQDFFRFNNVIHNDMINATFLQPLGRFKQRIAYANAFATDFQVPTATAAFISKDNRESMHYRQISGVKDNNANNTAADKYIRLVVETKRQDHCSANNDDDGRSNKDTNTIEDERYHVERMTTSLDNLGWTKVFCDVRSTLFSVPYSLFTTVVDDYAFERTRDSYSSAELYDAYASNQNLTSLSFPLGHTMMIANSKNGIAKWLNAGGMPVVDYIATQFVSNIRREDL